MLQRMYVCRLSHSCTVLKPMNGMRCHLSFMWSQITLCRTGPGPPMGWGDLGVETPSSRRCYLLANYFGAWYCCLGDTSSLQFFFLGVLVVFYSHNNNKDDKVYGAVIVASHFESSPASYDEYGAAADPQPRPNDPGCESACRLSSHTHHHHLLLLLGPKADTHFTIPWWVEGWVNLGTAVRVCSLCPRLYIIVVFT